MPLIEKAQPKPQRFSKGLIIGSVTILLLVLFGIVGIAIYVGYNLTKPERKEITQFPEDYGLMFQNVSFISDQDHLLLKGWWIPAQLDGEKVASTNTVIFAHGYGDVRTQEKISVLKLARRLTSEGYNVLLFDFRGSGQSEGDFVTIGQFEKDDLLSAAQFAKAEMGSERVSIIGWSMGAVTSILAMVESDDIQVVIADSPFADLRAYLEENLPYWSYLPSYPFTPLIINIIPYLSGIDADSVSPVHSVANMDKDDRLLLIHSTSDIAIPSENSEQILSAVQGKGQVELWTTNKGDHIESYITNEKEYEERILSFLGNQ